MMIVVSIKYVSVVLRADNQGEGGVLALMTLAHRIVNPKGRVGRGLMLLGLIGACFLYGDSLITPSISVMSAVEGLELVAPVMGEMVVPLSIAILFLLFFFQHYGTEKVGRSFGVVMLVWFTIIGILGVLSIVKAPTIFKAVNPLYAVNIFVESPWRAFVTLGSSFLALTGAEALYADLGHFGKNSIRADWFILVFPCLILNYLGQGSLLMSDPSKVGQLFFYLAPPWAILPLSILATAATIIASQAVISAAFSLTLQAMQLGLFPRFSVVHTSSQLKGQIYVPFINWALLAGTIILVGQFRHSDNLAGAYGVAISATMLITTLMILVVMVKRWKWELYKAFAVILIFLFMDCSFLGANLLKLPAGGWIPIALGSAIYLLMTTWSNGQKIVRSRMVASMVTEREFLEIIKDTKLCKVEGKAAFLSGRPLNIPPALILNILHNRVIHENTILLSVVNEEIPMIGESKRASVSFVAQGIYRVELHYGFMERPDIARDLRKIQVDGEELDPLQVTFFLGRLRMLIRKGPSMSEWRKSVYTFLVKNAYEASDYFRLPPGRVVEVNVIIEL